MKKAILLITILSLLNVSCGKDFSACQTYYSPENINDGIDVGTLEEVNIDTNLITNAVVRISQGKYKEVHSMLIFKDNKLVFEQYFKGHKYKWDGAGYYGEFVTWNRSMTHSIHSVTKSITSTCLGIAIDKGFIESVNQSIFDYLPKYQHLNKEGKDKITIEHLLTMTSGLEWDEWGAPNNSRNNDIINMWFQENPATYILEKPLINEPGTKFTYCGSGINVLGEIIKNATQMNLDTFSRKFLFEPLGIDSVNWGQQFQNGTIDAASGLKITPRDMIKIGAIFLNKGVWKEKQIISEQWVAKCATPFPGPDNSWFNHFLQPIPPDDNTWGRRGYSYSWWTHQLIGSGKKIKMFYAGGWGGQNIIVLPELNAVVVFTGGNYLSKTTVFKILKKYIIPAVD
jgi:CubicO group peptidase (beta-lactamase class C family)